VDQVDDLTDNEREEQLRRWWSENWLWIVGGIALGLALLAGWQYWQRSRLLAAERDQAAYESVLEALGANQFDEAVKHAAELRGRRPGSPYADQSDLALARAAVDRRDLAAAAGHLKIVADGAKDPELRTVARTRLARVLVEQGKFDEAVASLDVANAGAFAALYHDVRGDALAGKGDTVAARREYEAALEAGGEDSGIDRSYVELKRDALPAPTQPAAAQPAATGSAPVEPAPAQPAAGAP
jgi:predicted negative regulator of RcsB-dependent stress response